MGQDGDLPLLYGAGQGFALPFRGRTGICPSLRGRTEIYPPSQGQDKFSPPLPSYGSEQGFPPLYGAGQRFAPPWRGRTGISAPLWGKTGICPPLLGTGRGFTPFVGPAGRQACPEQPFAPNLRPPIRTLRGADKAPKPFIGARRRHRPRGQRSGRFGDKPRHLGTTQPPNTAFVPSPGHPKGGGN